MFRPEDTVDGGDKLKAMATSVDEQVPAVHLRADAARNRERIIEAAAEVFAARGLDVSTAEIAEHAGVGEATLFRRFPTKDALIDAILDQKMGETVDFLAELIAEPDLEVAFERLFIGMIGEKMQTDQGFYEAAGERCMSKPDFSKHRARAAGADRRPAEARPGGRRDPRRPAGTGHQLPPHGRLGAASHAAPGPAPGSV